MTGEIPASPGLPSLPPVQVVQNAYVVRDLERACHRLHALYRIGPFLRAAARPIANARYRGEPVRHPIVMATAFGQAGAVNIELIQPLSGAPNIYDEVVPPGRDGFHHVATWSSDYAAEKRAYLDAGFEIALELWPAPGCEVSFIDARPVLGHMIELYPDHPYLHFFYDEVRRRTREWDGADLILDIGQHPAAASIS